MAKQIKKNPNDFVQITRGYLQEIRELSMESPVSHSILLLFTERMNKTNAIVMSQATMSSILGVHRSTINRAVSILVKRKWVQVIKIGTANGYIVNSKVAWRSSNQTGERFATFHADVIVSESEQSQKIEDWDDIELKQIPILKPKEKPVKGNEDLPPPDQLDINDDIDDSELVAIKEDTARDNKTIDFLNNKPDEEV